MKNTEHSHGNRREPSRAEASKHKKSLAEPRVSSDSRGQKDEQDTIDKKEHEKKLAKVIADAKEYIKQKEAEYEREISRLKEEIESLTLQSEEASKEELTQKAIFDIASLGAQERVELAKIQGYLERQKDIEVAKLKEDTELEKKLEISLLLEEAEKEKNDALSKLKEEVEKEKSDALAKLKEEVEEEKRATISKIKEEVEEEKRAAISKIKEAEKRINARFSKLREEQERESKIELAQHKKELEREMKIELAKLQDQEQKGILDAISKTEKTIAEYQEALAETELKYERLKIKNEQLLHIYSDKIIKWELGKEDSEHIISRSQRTLEPKERDRAMAFTEELKPATSHKEERGTSFGRIEEPGISSERKEERGVSAERKEERGISAERKEERGVSAERKEERGISAERKEERGVTSERKEERGISFGRKEEPGISSERKEERGTSAEHKVEQEISSRYRGEREVLSENKNESKAIVTTTEKVAQKPKNLFFDLISTLILIGANLLFIFVVYPNITAWIDYVGLNNLTLMIRILITMLGAMVSLFCFAKTREFATKRALKNPQKRKRKQVHSLKFLIGTVAVGVILLGIFLFSSIFLFFLIGTALILLAALLVPDYS